MASTSAGRASSGRFLPPDPRVAEPYRFTPQLALRLAILGAIAIAIFAVLLFRLWALNPAAIEEEAVAEYVRCFRLPGAMRAAFDDYRAGATTDLEHDGADRDKKVTAPTLVLWGEGRAAQAQDMLAAWKARCERVEGGPVAGSGHFIPEEQPQAVIDALVRFAG